MSTTPAGVQAEISSGSESAFQNLFDKGAFEPSINQAPPIDRYKGSDQAEPKEKPAKVAKAPAEKPAIEAKPAEAEGDDAAQLQAAADAEVPVEEGDEETPEAKVYASLEDFAKEAGVEFDSLQDLSVPVKVDGKSELVSLKDVIKSYQLESHVNNKSIEYSDKLRAFDTERQQVQQALAQQIQNAQTLFSIAEQQVLGDYARVDWATLKAQDPARFAAETIEYQNRIAAIRGQVEQINQSRAMEAQRAQEATAKLLPQQKEKMLESIPEWRDGAKFEADRKVILTYGKQLGFTDAELANVNDHRHMRILHDAARYANQQAAKPAILKQVRAAPTMAKPGSRSEKDPRLVARQQAHERFARNPRDQDAQVAVFETLV